MLPYNHKVTAFVKYLNKEQTRESLEHHFENNEETKKKIERFFQNNNAFKHYLSALNPEKKVELIETINLHMNALLEGIRHGGFHVERQPAQPLPTPPQPPRVAAQTQPQVRVYIYETHHYHYWHDWWIWQCYSPSYYTPYYPSSVDKQRSNSTKNEKNEEQLGIVAIVIAVILSAIALIAVSYTFIEIAKVFDQLASCEDVFGNLSKLALTAFGGIAGISFGLMLGVALFNSSTFGAIIGCLIVSGAAIYLSNRLMESMHARHNFDSSLDYDPRFCLTSEECHNLSEKGYDIKAVSEAIREVAIHFDEAHQNSWSIQFWSKENREKAIMVDLMRQLKRGFPSHIFTFNRKRFELIAPTQSQNVNFNSNLSLTGVVMENWDNAYTQPTANNAPSLASPPPRPLECVSNHL